MKLTGREKSSLILEGVVTVVLLVLLNMAIIMIIQDVIQGNPGVTNGIFMISSRCGWVRFRPKSGVTNGLSSPFLW